MSLKMDTKNYYSIIQGEKHMKHRNSQKALSVIMAVVMIFACLVNSSTVALAQDALKNLLPRYTDYQMDSTFVHTGETLALTEDVTILVNLDSQPTYLATSDLERAMADTERQMAELAEAQQAIESYTGQTIEVQDHFTLLFHAFSFTGPEWMVTAINDIPGLTAMKDIQFELVETTSSDNQMTPTPSMTTSSGLVGADISQDLGYTGEGMVVAILDSGIRRTHEAFSVMPENPKMDADYLREVYTKYGKQMHCGSLKDVDDIYYSDKLPFNWDYADRDANPNHPNITYGDHGTHVAGIAAGNNGKTGTDKFQGIAPDAQIVTMKIFYNDGTGSFAYMMAALEDCIYLGVDVINMSLGLTSGFSAYESLSTSCKNIYNALEKAGITIIAAAGNTGYNITSTNYADKFNNQQYWAAWNMDVGTVSSPATIYGSFGVASVVNTDTKTGTVVTVADSEYYPGYIAGCPTLNTLGAGEFDLVYVGLGSPEEIQAAGGVNGKIALIKRGSLTFSAKIQNAIAAGAVGCIIFNSSDGDFKFSANTTLPLATLSGIYGQEILSKLADGVHGKITIRSGFSTQTVKMADTSSWGTTADLRITPEISAPGDNIYSAIGLKSDSAYAVYSGTSMAAPHIAGGMLLIKQYLRTVFPDATATEINDLAYSFAMSTANQVNGFVRQQGAGLLNLSGALSTKAYITVPGANRPKLEFDDSQDGTFTFTFSVTNFGTAAKTYAVDFSAMTETVVDLEYSGNVMNDWQWSKDTGFYVANPETVTIKAINGTIMDVTDMCSLTGPETLTVPAGETVTVTMTLAAADELMKYFTDNCPAGMYLEGHIILRDQDTSGKGVNLSMPYLGFVGDWDYAPMFDIGMYWNNAWGENNLSQMIATQGTFVGYGVCEQGLGMNPYVNTENETYLADRNAISPNGDDYLDAVNYAEFSMMRNAKYVKAYVQDAEGNVLTSFVNSKYSYRKEGLVSGFYSYISCSNMNFNYDGTGLAENETVYLVLEAWLDHAEYDPANNMNGRIIIPITKDTIAPAVKAVAGGLQIQDANYIAYYAVYADAAMTELLYETGVFAEARNVAELYQTDAEQLYIKVADYAHNEALYAVVDGQVIAMETDLPGREIVCRTYARYLASSRNEYAWTQINSESHVNMKYLTGTTYLKNEYAAASNGGYDFLDAVVDVDGTVYVAANAKISDIYTMDPETFEMTLVGPVWSEGSTYARIYNLTMDPVTYELYAFASTSGHDKWLFSLDLETLELVPLYEFVNISTQDALSATEWAAACIGNGQIALWGFWNWLGIYDLATGQPIRVIKMIENKYNIPEFGINGLAGNMLYDEVNNDLLLFSNWQYFRHEHGNYQGMVKLDLDTEEVTLHSVSNGKVSFHGMYFADELDGAPFWQVQEQIKAIGQVSADSVEAVKAAREAYDALPENEKAMVENYSDLIAAEAVFNTMELIQAIGKITVDSGEAIQAAREAYDALPQSDKTLIANYADLLIAENVYPVQAKIHVLGQATTISGEAIQAAREAYDALPESQKALVSNYMDLIIAEHNYMIPKLEESSFQSALYYARMVQLSLDNYNTSGFSPQQAESFTTAKTAFTAAVAAAKDVDAIHAALDSLFTVLEILEALHVHQGVLTKAAEATCTQTGYTGDTICQYCGDILTAGENIPMLSHEAVLTGYVKQTCTAAGYTGDEVCRLCNNVLKEGQAILMLDHEVVLSGSVEQTCTTDGYTGDEVCQLCSNVIQKGHIIPAVCENTGFVYVSNNNGTHIRKTSCCDTVEDPDEDCVYGTNYTCQLCGYAKAAITVTVTDGVITGENGTSITIYESRLVTVTANAAPDGKVFRGWQMNGQLVSTDSIYTFTATENTEISALYEDADTANALLTGIVIACLAVLAVGELVIYFLLRKKKTT